MTPYNSETGDMNIITIPSGQGFHMLACNPVHIPMLQVAYDALAVKIIFWCKEERSAIDVILKATPRFNQN